MKLIYVIEDHKVIAEGVKQYLAFASYEVKTFYNLTTAKVALEEKKPDLIIQDVMLPDGDGFSFIKEFKKNNDCLVIFMTARITEEDRIKGFDIGADDYVVKPFSTRELMRRVKVLLKRVYKKDQTEILTYKGLVLNSNKMMVLNEGKNINLTSTEFSLLETFMKNIGVVLSRDQLIQDSFGYNYEAYNRNIDTYVKKLRKKLAPLNYIQTKYGSGYRFGEDYDN